MIKKTKNSKRPFVSDAAFLARAYGDDWLGSGGVPFVNKARSRPTFCPRS